MIQYLEWVKTLAFRATEEDIPDDDMMTLWIFIQRATKYIRGVKASSFNYGKPKYYISRSNTLLRNTKNIIDKNLAVKVSNMPEIKDEYDKAECAAIKKAVVHLHKKYSGLEESCAWKFCQRFRFYESGNRNTHTPSANKLNYAKMMVVAYG